MLIAKVIGTTVSTVKDEKLTGRKLLILRQTDEAGSPAGKPYVAVDTVDAGVGDLVLTCAGSSARQNYIPRLPRYRRPVTPGYENIPPPLARRQSRSVGQQTGHSYLNPNRPAAGRIGWRRGWRRPQRYC